MTTNIFEKASRNKLRFDTKAKGSVNVETLWDLPLSQLDEMYVRLNRELRELGEDSLIKRSNPKTSELKLQVEIVKHVVQVRLEEKEAAEQKAKRAEDKEFIKQVLAQRERDELLNTSKEELIARLNAD